MIWLLSSYGEAWRGKFHICRLYCFTGKTSRIDAVWDQYTEVGLKALTPVYRGSGTRAMLDPAGAAPIPRGKVYERFLHNTENKRQFFSFCSKQLCYHLSQITEKLIITTDEEKVLSNHDLDLSMLQPCNHAETDTRIILHLFHAASEGHKFALVRTVNSDVVILCLFFFVKLGFVELWVIFGVGKSIRNIPIHNLYVQLGPERSQTLLLFHALTGWNTVSQIGSAGKKTAWQVWEKDCSVSGELIKTFNKLLAYPEQLSLESLEMKSGLICCQIVQQIMRGRNS